MLTLILNIYVEREYYAISVEEQITCSIPVDKLTLMLVMFSLTTWGIHIEKRVSDEQIISFLREAEAVVSRRELCRRRAISDATFYP